MAQRLAPRRVESSQTRDETIVPKTSRQILNQGSPVHLSQDILSRVLRGLIEMRPLSSLPAMTNCHRLSGTNRHFFSHSSWRLQVQDQDVSSVIPSEASFLSSDCRILAVSSHGLSSTCASYKGTRRFRSGAHPYDLFQW